MDLLKGIMDTDGTVTTSGMPLFTTTSEQLAKDVRWLCHSLGYNSTMYESCGQYKKDGVKHVCSKVYRVTIYTNDRIFRL